MEHFFFPRIQVKTKKKRSSPKHEILFSPNSSRALLLDARQSQIIGEDADVDHTKIIGGILSNYISPISPGFGTPASTKDARCARKTLVRCA